MVRFKTNSVCFYVTDNKEICLSAEYKIAVSFRLSPDYKVVSYLSGLLLFTVAAIDHVELARQSGLD